MTVAFRKPLTQQEFFHWAEAQDTRYEFDGFQPVAMTGGSLRHSRLTGNITRQLGSRLAGSGCVPLGPDAGIATMGDTVRYPDAVVTCSKFDDLGRLVPNPVVVFEVIGPSSIRTDRMIKLREYQAVPTIRRYVVVESDAATVTVLSRDNENEPFRAAALGEDDVLDLPETGIGIPVAAIYEGIVFGETNEGAGL